MGGTATLVTNRPGLTLEPEAAASWARMEAAVGVLDVNRSYADWDTQMRLYNEYQAYRAYVEKRGPYAPWAPLALHPNASMHCRGLAVDTDDDARVRAVPQFGWVFNVPSEKWHAEYRPQLDRFRGTGIPRPASSNSEPFIPEPPEEETMRVIRWAQSHILVFGPQQVLHINNYDQARAAAIIHEPDKNWREYDDLGLTVTMMTFGVPWSAVDACMRGLAYDIDGSVGGRFWSRAIEQKIDTANLGRNLATSLDDLKKRVADVTPVVDPAVQG